MFDSSFKILFFILGICVVIYIIGIVSRHRFTLSNYKARN